MADGTGNVYFYHNGDNSTPLVITDAGGNMVWWGLYEPFGAGHFDGTVENNFRFPGQYYDEELGFNYNWWRYYSFSTGRYISPDPEIIQKGPSWAYFWDGKAFKEVWTAD